MEQKANAIRQLLPRECYRSAKVSQEGEICRITLEGVDDPDRRIDTVIQHCRSLVMPEIRLNIQHKDDHSIIDLDPRK